MSLRLPVNLEADMSDQLNLPRHELSSGFTEDVGGQIAYRGLEVDAIEGIQKFSAQLEPCLRRPAMKDGNVRSVRNSEVHSTTSQPFADASMKAAAHGNFLTVHQHNRELSAGFGSHFL